MDIIFIHVTVDFTLENRECGNEIKLVRHELDRPIDQMKHGVPAIRIGSVIKPMAINFHVLFIPFDQIPFSSDIAALCEGNREIIATAKRGKCHFVFHFIPKFC
jgi:hypothetical protein